jgi:hypothetical protein
MKSADYGLTTMRSPDYDAESLRVARNTEMDHAHCAKRVSGGHASRAVKELAQAEVRRMVGRARLYSWQARQLLQTGVTQ